MGCWVVRGAPGVVDVVDPVARLIEERRRELGFTLRRLARLAGVSHSSLSRLLAGRTTPGPGLLRALAEPLGLPPDVLLAAAGLASETQDAWRSLRDMGMEPAPPRLVAQIAARLEELRAEAAGATARQSVREGLNSKLELLGAAGPVIERLRRLAALYLDEGAPPDLRWIAGGAVLYFLAARDAIDDTMFPIGYLDDAVAVALTEAQLRRLGNPEP